MVEHHELQALLPHGHPMLLVDRVEFVNDELAIGLKAISASDPCFAGIPRGRPRHYPHSLLLESFGQTGALLWLRRRPCPPGHVLLFGGARGCRMIERVGPGDLVRHEARLEHLGSDTAFVTGVSFVGERAVARFATMALATRAAGPLGR
jgi:3-hydroxyacyl-[acyl-carrier-protein] dehydratase